MVESQQESEVFFFFGVFIIIIISSSMVNSYLSKCMWKHKFHDSPFKLIITLLKP